MNTITIELCAEDRARLDAILAALSARPNCERCANTVAKYVAAEVGQTAEHPVVDPFPAPDTAEKSNDAPTEAEPETVNTPEPEKPAEAEEQPEAPAVTHADIQRKVVTLSAAGKKDQVREIVTKYAKKVSDLPEDKLAEVWAKLTALEV